MTFTRIPPARGSAKSVPHLEYHYLPEIAPHGPWSISTFRPDVYSQCAWKVIADGDAKVLAQTYKNLERHFHPMVIAGDPLWTNYTLRVRFTPGSAERRSGVVFRYRNDRCYYFFGVERGKAVLRLVQNETAFRQPYEKTLAEEKFSYEPGKDLVAVVEVHQNQIRASIENGPTLAAEDNTYPAGKIGLLSDVPTRFKHVEVTTSAVEERQTTQLIAQRDAAELQLQATNPKPVLWKHFKTPDFGADHNIRFGDLDGDKVLDILIGQIEHHGPKDRNSELSCLTALTLDGKKLWQVGTPDAWRHQLTNDVGFQIHDLDGDGKSEVVYTMGQELIVADGATGLTKQKIPTPDVPTDGKKTANRYPRILGDALLFCDFRGVGHDSDIVIKDRYWNFWAFDDQLQLLWSGNCNTGHYPYAEDVDGDGHDELFIGYSCYDHKGKRLWTLEKEVQDHADGIAAVRLDADPTAKPKVVCFASDEGVYFADLDGNILQHHRVGHAQSGTVANFRDDLPGLEVIASNFWGNQGIIHLFDSRGQIQFDIEPCQHASACAPVNWTGKTEEFFLLSANVELGGMFDGVGRRVVRFPNDGHPDRCSAALDLTGDCRDEIVVWDPHEIWIYTQDDNPKQGKLYQPKRNPLYNASNYQLNVSVPNEASSN